MFHRLNPFFYNLKTNLTHNNHKITQLPKTIFASKIQKKLKAHCHPRERGNNPIFRIR